MPPENLSSGVTGFQGADLPAQPAQLDEYRLLRPLGSGAMGTVYLAHDTLLDRAVALKFLSVPHATASQRARFLTEARALARLHHPNIVTVHRAGEHDGQPYLVSEYVRGQPLSGLKKPLPAEQIRALAIDLCRGLQAAHRSGVLHRDIKPANAIRAEDGQVKLLDFGLAKLLEDRRLPLPSSGEPAAEATSASETSTRGAALLGASTVLALDATASLDGVARQSLSHPEQEEPAMGVLLATQAGARMGTPLYMAPELWQAEPATIRSDLYALGALLYELACGRPPHTGADLGALERAVLSEPVAPLTERVPGFDPALAAPIERCLDRSPSLRPASAALLLTELESPRHCGQALPPTQNPYRGLMPFEAEHRALFMGRSAEVRQVIDLLRTRSLVAVSGSSGVGKSSLCRAGVVPAIRQGALADGRDWQAVQMVPGKRPLLTLAGSLAPHLGLTSEETRLLAEKDPAALVRGLLLRLESPADGRDRRGGLLLFIDQMEELVSQGEAAEGPLFGELLSEFLTPLPGLRVLVSVRGDFLFRVLEATGLHQDLAQSLYVLPPLSSTALEEVITEPARLCGFAFEEPAQAAAMAQSAAHAEGGLPLLQFALAELWELRDKSRHVIPAAALAQIGGVAGALGRYADGILNRLPSAENRAAHQLLTRLITSAGTRATRTRADLAVGPPAEQTATVGALEALVRARLLVARQSPIEGAVYEIAHEALLQGWGTLLDLITQDAGRRAVIERLGQAAAEWERLGRIRSALWQDRQLAEVEAARLRSADLPRRAGTFLAASQRAARRQRLLRYSLPAAAVLALLGAERGVRWYSGRPARALVTRAEQAMQQAHSLRAETAALQARAYLLFDEQETKAGNEVYAQALARRQEALAAYQRVQTEAAGALTLRSNLTQAAALIQKSTRERELLLRAFSIGAHADNDSEAPARLTLRVRPEGTAVVLQRADGNTAYRGWLAEEPLGVTPLIDRPLPSGSYLLTLRAPGRVTTRHPVYLYAGEALRGEFELPRPEQVPEGMVYIPPGRFLYGSGEAEEIRAWQGAQPIHPVWTDGYLIARHETTYGEWIQFLEALPGLQRALYMPRAAGEKGRSVGLDRLGPGSYRLTLRPTGEATFMAVTGEPIRYPQRDRRSEQDWYKFPVTGISREDAEAYAHRLHETRRLPGARLCSEHEWERAAKGADDRRFPPGDELAPDDANIDITYGRDGFGPDEVCLHPRPRSPFGVGDLAGNVREWVRAAKSTEYVYRDGSFYQGSRTSRSTNRQVGAAGQRNILIGTRLCKRFP